MLTALHSFACDTTGQVGCVAGQRVKVVRAFRVNSGERVAVADPESGEVLHWQVPVEWFSRPRVAHGRPTVLAAGFDAGGDTNRGGAR